MSDTEKLTDLLSSYFGIGDSYVYNLTRDKAAFGIGTMEFEDFEEFDDESVVKIAQYLIDHGVTFAEDNKVLGKRYYSVLCVKPVIRHPPLPFGCGKKP